MRTIPRLAAIALFMTVGAAHATQFSLDITASGFIGISNSEPAPQNPVDGSITFTAASLGAPVTSVDAVDLTIGGHVYAAAEVGEEPYGGSYYLFCATQYGVNSVVQGTDDFYLVVSPFNTSMVYGIVRRRA